MRFEMRVREKIRSGMKVMERMRFEMRGMERMMSGTEVRG